jgi:hypothetical protein
MQNDRCRNCVTLEHWLRDYPQLVTLTALTTGTSQTSTAYEVTDACYLSEQHTIIDVNGLKVIDSGCYSEEICSQSYTVYYKHKTVWHTFSCLRQLEFEFYVSGQTINLRVVCIRQIR